MSLFCRTYLATELNNCEKFSSQVNYHDSFSSQQEEMGFGGSCKKCCQFLHDVILKRDALHITTKMNRADLLNPKLTLTFYHIIILIHYFLSHLNSPKWWVKLFKMEWFLHLLCFLNELFKYSSFWFQPSRRQKSTELSSLCCTSYLNLLLHHILSLTGWLPGTNLWFWKQYFS